MFNQRRGFGLFHAIGVAAGVVALAGAGTFYFFNRKRSARLVTQAKKAVKRTIPQVTRAASQIKLNGRAHGKSASKSKSHAKSNHHVNGVNHARA
jgi:hypothetical protein